MKNNPFCCFNSSPEIIRPAVMTYIRYSLSLRQVEDILFERGIDICHETIRYWWNRFGPLFAGEVRSWRLPRDATTRTGAGTSMRSLSGSTARDTPYGAPSTMKARCSKQSSQGSEIAEPHSISSSAR